MKIASIASLLALAVTCTASMSAFAADPDFGPNVVILSPTSDNIQGQVSAICDKQQGNQFGSERYAILFKPGSYNVDVPIGFYTTVAGLGQSPDDVAITGEVRATSKWMNGNATCNFWRAMENLSQSPIHRNTAVWAVSQGTDMRRIHVKGNLGLSEGGWSSGGFLADSKVDGKVQSGSQQQWLSRNDEIGGWSNGVWNMVFVGVNGAPHGGASYTDVDKTPVIREKPFLVFADGKYEVMVPPLATNTSGTDWTTPGKAIPISDFYIAHDKDSAATINAALAAGKNLLLTPGLYHLEASIQVTRPDTVVLGIGFPTLTPKTGAPAIQIADVDGVKIGGILLEAGATPSPTLMEVGKPGSSANHASNPTFMWDVHARSGGAVAGSCGSFVTINSNNVVGDNSWLWRADHGAGAAWDVNKTTNGLIVNGKDVTFYGLFVEHCQQYQTLWNANGGRVYFYQSEFPYDPPSVEGWSHNGVSGYASYKVADNVTTHQAWGVGIYAFFHDPFTVETAMEAPAAPGIVFDNLCTFHGKGTVTHVLNNKSGGGGNPSRLAN